VLFGSWARGEASEESDVDVLVLIASGTSRERLRAIEIGAEVGFEHRLVIDPVVLSDRQWDELARRERSLVREVLLDGAEVSA
jgi:predicted nucleotidyltransferase